MEELHDRGSIKPRLGSLRGGIAAIRADDDRRMTRTTIMARSPPDHAPIVAKMVAIWKKN